MNRMKDRQNIRVALAGVVFAATAALPLSVGAQEVTYAADIAPIVQENCVRCHRAGTAAPMVLVLMTPAPPRYFPGPGESVNI